MIIKILSKLINKLQLILYKFELKKSVKGPVEGARLLGKFYFCASDLQIGKNVTIYPGVTIRGEGKIRIGDNVTIGQNTNIYAARSIAIGNDVSIAADCYIIDCNHGISKDILIREQGLEYDENGIVIGNDVWLGAGSKVLKGSYINDGAVIGAMSLVNCNIDRNAIAVGIPAKVLKYRV